MVSPEQFSRPKKQQQQAKKRLLTNISFGQYLTIIFIVENNVL